MKTIPEPPSILLIGIGVRLLWAVILLMALWAGFFWATSTTGTS